MIALRLRAVDHAVGGGDAACTGGLITVPATVQSETVKGIDAGDLCAEAGSGYQGVAYTVRLKTRGATAQELEQIRQACLTASPVGDTLERRVPVTLQFDAR
jgi:hypothetical protein